MVNKHLYHGFGLFCRQANLRLKYSSTHNKRPQQGVAKGDWRVEEMTALNKQMNCC